MENEVRLINYDAAIDRYYAEYEKQDICDGADDRDWLKKCFDEAPTIDPESLRPKGRWIVEKRRSVSSNPYMDDDYHIRVTCSECGYLIQSEIGSFGYPKLKTTNYCPNCGAKMEG